ncbi:pentatricopeptide repeat-containing protein At5g57250, mitochondrial [Mercurialis annua]|uniref:pentatricopeptide repeat-containing protein At5g57250, mitochondrial n=1 Tax=Mercurialis annua TaxID=3986 RepID=UPI0021602528|nr:pentatricopeptide repeat-containing protein At5g57250, mitochondrial [Mercurialis annua]XP_050217940.1 pentatricopeptide repeat-containing protein At5g57250, mitochondrial [Mercurialis annua]XP_050217942.1 pentatricopeptide repeat-containing protein At5g57250, mitochondrial [Mercurialis annua]XP_050217943.1 pentatricopeptide repeat-containing protein At5g57250, mitochondrial [Mercurialis annua]XP_050217944.1 pentatricopeptide repeat-containing protein At5g57250, mitochondrial [Mercurialis an
MISRFFSSSSSSSSSSSCIQNLLKRGFTPTLKSINQYILFLLKTHKKYTLVPHFLSQLNQNHFQFNHQTHSLFTKFEEAELFINTHMKKPSNFSKSSQLCDSLIHSFILRGGAIQVFELMNDEKVKYPLCNFVCSLIISRLYKIGKPEFGLVFFENCVNVGNFKANLVTYTAVVCSLCMLGRVNEVCNLVCKMEKEGLGFDVVFYSSWIHGYFRNGVLMEAIRKHRKMVEMGINDDVVSYTILIDGFSKVGLVEKAVGFLHKMISDGIRPNLVTYSALVLGFCRKGKMDEAFAVFKMVEGLEFELEEFIYAILVDGFCSKGDFDRAYRLIEEMEKKRISPNIVTYNTLINRLCKSGRTSDADEISKVIQGDNVTYSALLHGYIKEGNHIGILDVKRRLEQATTHMDIVMCNIIMKALFTVGAIEDVHVLYRGMQDMNLVADSVTYCTMIDGYCKVGRVDKALEIFDEFKHGLGSSVACYNSMIDGLCKMGMVDMAAEAFVELNAKGLPLDVGICMTLMKEILKEGSAEGVLGLIHRISNLKLDACDTTLWNCAINLLLQNKFYVAAGEVYVVARMKKLVLASKSSYMIIKGLIRDGKVGTSQPILCNFLKEFGLIQHEVSKSVLHYLCLKDVKSALKFFNRMKKQSAFVSFPVSTVRILTKNGRFLDAYKVLVNAEDDLPVLDMIDYSIIIDGLCKEGHPIKALDVCVFAEKKGITLNIITYNSVMSGLCGQGCLVEAFRVFDSLERIKLIPSEITYSILIDNLCKDGYFLDAKQLLERMAMKGFKRNTRIYNSFINGYCKFGQLEEASKILKDIEIECLDLDEFTISSMINGYCVKGDIHRAQNFFFEQKEKGSTPDFLGFLYLMRGLCAKGMMEEARSILREMLQSASVIELLKRVNAEVETECVESFLIFLCEQGSIKEAVTVLNEIASMFFPGQKWCGPCESQELQKLSETEFSNTLSLPESTNFGIESDDVINVDKTVERYGNLLGTKHNFFDFYYSEIDSLCSSGELERANRFAKEMLTSWEGNC